MPVWPKSIHTFGVNLRTAATEWKLRQKRAAAGQQERTFATLSAALAATSHWRQAGVERGMSYETFRTRVPLQRYEELAPEIARMVAGEKDVLWPGACALFAWTAGTSTGEPRLIPMTDALLRHVRLTGYDAALYYTVRVRHAGAFRGRHLLLGSAPTLVALPEAPHAMAAELSGLAALTLPGWVDQHLYEPGLSPAAEPDFAARLAAIVRRTRSRDITLVGGQPAWLLQLAAAYGEPAGRGHPAPALQTIWPNLEACVTTGQLATPYWPQLRAAFGANVVTHDFYAATEACLAAQDADHRSGLRLIADRGVFFEFLPLADYANGRLEQLGPRARSLGEVETGVDYVVLLTTPGGLARYVLGDVVRFTSLQPPRLHYVGGTELRLAHFGENVSERDVTDALAQLCGRQDWSLVNFHVAPLLGATDLTGQAPGRHEWWVELKPGTVATPTGPQMATELDAFLQKTNPAYAARRKAPGFEAPYVRLVMPGVFGHWQRFHGRLGNQAKIPRCRPDRRIADELAQITNFARD
jgi:hypothetical protein